MLLRQGSGVARGSLLDERLTRTSRASVLYTIKIAIENYFSTEFRREN
jgi:hypothetical protein